MGRVDAMELSHCIFMTGGLAAEIPDKISARDATDELFTHSDGVSMQAIQAVYPKSRLQRCIVHQIRSSTKYVSYKDIKQVTADLKKVYW